MSSRTKRGASRAGTAAAAGLAAAAFGGGVAAATVTGPHATTAKIFACYSEKNGAMYRATSTTCPTGERSLTWNVKGPQGAQGPQGPQGAKGAQAAVPPTAKSGAIDIPTAAAVSAFVFSPPATGSYAVSAAVIATTGPRSGGFACELETHTQTVGETTVGSGGASGSQFVMHFNGIIHAIPHTSPIVGACFATGGSTGYRATLVHYVVTAQRVATGSGAALPASGLANRFVPRR